MLSDHGQTQGGTFRQRDGYGLDKLVERHLDALVSGVSGGDEQSAMVRHAVDGASCRRRPSGDVSGRGAVVLGSGNLGLV